MFTYIPDLKMSATVQPVIFLSHGAGPSFFLSVKEHPGMKGVDKDSTCAEFFRNMVKSENIPQPRAILIVSAHWEETQPTVMTTKTPTLYYDYTGFPKSMYQLKWPAPGAPDIARATAKVLESYGFKCGEDDARGFDHGVFVPLIQVYPKADIPGKTQKSTLHD